MFDPNELVSCYLTFTRFLGITLGDVFSADGKTMRGVAQKDANGKDTVKHILSLFSHVVHSVIVQNGVDQKENEIPSLRRLLQQPMVKRQITGKLLLADALHTNPDTADVILAGEADYLLVIKGNQEDFFDSIQTAFADQKDLPGHSSKSYALLTDRDKRVEYSRKRDITTLVMSTNDEQLCSYLIKEHKFKKIQTVGILKRTGSRRTKDGTEKAVDETICFVSSRKLGAAEVQGLLHKHWCIENNLHWVKDFVFLEDRQTLRTGNAPQVMSFLRSMCISICNLAKFKSISQALDTFAKNKTVHYQFLRMAAIV
jgi:predicted transposase YbfD/YdcC